MFDPKNSLENLLVLTAKDEGNRPAFYRELLSSTIYVLGEMEEEKEEWQGAEPGKLHLNVWSRDSKTIVPAFTSPERARVVAGESPRLVGLPGHALIQMLQGTWLVLNPGSEIGKEFSPPEIEALGDGSLFHSVSSSSFADPTPAVLRPSPPGLEDLTSALSTLFERHPSIQGAYLAEIEVPSNDIPPHPVLGLDFGIARSKEEEDEQENLSSTIVQEAGIVIATTVGDRGPIDILVLGENEISDFFRKEVDPFYGASPRSPISQRKLNTLLNRNELLEKEGITIVLGAIVQAGDNLWYAGDDEQIYPAIIVYSLSPDHRTNRIWLRRMAQRLFALRKEDWEALSALERSLVQRMLHPVEFFGSPLPPEFSGDPHAHWGYVALSRDQLPQGSLPRDGILPLYVTLPSDEVASISNTTSTEQEEGFRIRSSEPLDIVPSTLWERDD